jgi:putative ABC transport system ATP-binding protein
VFPSNALLRTENLQRHFQMGSQTVCALDGIDLTIHQGEFLALMGPSGSGKSTLLYLLGGLDRPTAGQIWVRNGRGLEPQGLDMMDEDALAVYRGHQIGFVFQSFHLIPTMTALQNVTLPMLFVRGSAIDRRERAMVLLEQVGLADRLDHRPTELSGGQQQRVAIARALVNNPILILADEPTGNLDSHTGQEILGLLASLSQQEQRTIVMVSHDPTVTNYATRTIHLKDGRIVDEQTRSQDETQDGHFSSHPPHDAASDSTRSGGKADPDHTQLCRDPGNGQGGTRVYGRDRDL